MVYFTQRLEVVRLLPDLLDFLRVRQNSEAPFDRPTAQEAAILFWVKMVFTLCLQESRYHMSFVPKFRFLNC
jgi:hypothetical protein